MLCLALCGCREAIDKDKWKSWIDTCILNGVKSTYSSKFDQVDGIRSKPAHNEGPDTSTAI